MIEEDEGDMIEEDEGEMMGKIVESSDSVEFMEENRRKRNTQERKTNSIRLSSRPAPLQVLDHVKINNTLETPRSTITGCLNLNVPQPRRMNFTRENLDKVENQLKLAFIEFYNKLRLLKSYR